MTYVQFSDFANSMGLGADSNHLQSDLFADHSQGQLLNNMASFQQYNGGMTVNTSRRSSVNIGSLGSQAMVGMPIHQPMSASSALECLPMLDVPTSLNGLGPDPSLMSSSNMSAMQSSASLGMNLSLGSNQMAPFLSSSTSGGDDEYFSNYHPFKPKKRWTTQETRKLIQFMLSHRHDYGKSYHKHNFWLACYKYFQGEGGMGHSISPKQLANKWKKLKSKYKRCIQQHGGAANAASKSSWAFFSPLHDFFSKEEENEYLAQSVQSLSNINPSKTAPQATPADNDVMSFFF
jgi:hypothetical protein